MKKFNKKLPILFASLALAMGVGLIGGAKEVNAEQATIDVVTNGSLGPDASTVGTAYTSGNDYYGVYGGGYFKVSLSSVEAGSQVNFTYDIGTFGGFTQQKQTFTVAAYSGNSLVSSSTTFAASKKNTSKGADTGSGSITLNSGVTEVELRFISDETSTVGVFARVYNLAVTYTKGEEIKREVESVTGVESYPTEIFVGESIDGADVELNVLYDDGESGLEPAHHVDVDSSVAANGVTATAYYDEEGTMSATFTVDVLELPNTIALFESSKVVTTQNYKAYSNSDWILTFGGNNVSGGTNSNNASSCKVDSKYIGDAGVSSSVISFAIVSANKLDNAGKVVFTYSGGNNYSNGKMYLTSSVDGSDYSMVTLTSGEQGMSVGSTNIDYVFEFEKIESAYYAIIIVSTASTGNFRFDNIIAEFFAAPEKVNLVEQFINDWKEMRAGGTRGICDYDLNGTNALTDLLKRFEDFGEEDKALIRESIDVDDVTIGQTLDYINNVLKSEAAASEDNTLNSFIISVSDNNTTSLVALFAVLGLVAVSAYYFIEKKKLAR